MAKLPNDDPDDNPENRDEPAKGDVDDVGKFNVFAGQRRLTGWQRVAGIAIVGTLETAVTLITGSAESAVLVVSPLVALVR